MNKRNLSMLDEYQKFKDVQRTHANKMKNKAPKVFKVKKVHNKRDSGQDSPYNTSSEEQKNSSNTSGGYKTQNNGSNFDSNGSTVPSTNYICLSNGKVIIKGNEIETTVP